MKEPARVVTVPTPMAVSDAELTDYVRWMHDWISLGSRHKAALDAEMPRIQATLAVDRTYKVANDPAILALVARQRAEMQTVMSRAPHGAAADALAATLQCVGRMVVGSVSNSIVHHANCPVLVVH